MKKLLLLVLLTVSYTAMAEIRLPAVLGDRMVLQRNSEVKLWGWAKENTKVKVRTSWDSRKYDTVSDSEGYWMVEVSTSDAGGPYEITISDGTKKVISDVLLGEVWICSGQSNMEMPLGGYIHQPVANATAHIRKAFNYPQIRLLTVPRVGKSGAVKSPYGFMPYEWKTVTPENAREFSAIGYMFAETLTDCLGGVPVGVISANWGGSDVSTWMTQEYIDSTPDIDVALAKSGTEDNTAPSSLFDNMLKPLIPFKTKGVLWYQGEQNRYNWFDYKNLLVSMVRCWRDAWEDPEMRFYQIQLAPFCYEGEDLRSIGVMNEAQYKACLEIPFSGVVASVDAGDIHTIHPSGKEVLADRLAWLALAEIYGIKGLPMPAPVYKSMEVFQDETRGRVVALRFQNLSDAWNEFDSLYLYDQGYWRVPQGFEIAGEDRVFHKADAAFKWGNTIEVWSKDVPAPVAVRYAFRNWCPEANVITTQGQPLMPFRTDEWPVDDIFNK